CEVLMKLKDRPDAIFSISDTISIGAMTYALNNGITVGKDVLFFGFDNIAYSHMFIPHLTTVEQPCYLQGKAVIEKLIGNIKSDVKDNNTYKLPHRLILRESTGDKST
ncbi:MAG TPA: LacI family transcriptional regulator, partial [Ruminococcaceae bacterium]|nr:LacI family transcriptional regulator [Oscillospiraceae bacterium]